MGRNALLLKNTFIISVGKVCTQLITYLLLPLYTSVLSTSEYGTIDLLFTYILLISPVVTVQMEASIFRFLIDARGNEREIARVITNCVTCAVCPTLAFSAGFLCFAPLLGFEYTGAFVLGVIANSMLSIALQIARGLGDNISYAIGSAISGILTVSLNVLFVIVWSSGVAGMLYSTAIAQLMGLSYILIRDKIFKYIDFSLVCRRLIKEMANYSLPLILNGLSWWIISASDRTIVSLFLGTQANGILAVAAKLSAIVANVFAIFNLSWTESVALHIKDKDRDRYISDITRQCFNLFGACGITLIMGCAVFFKYMVDERFSAAFPLIPLLVIGGIINVVQTLYGIIYIGLKNTKQVSRTAFIAAIINFVVNLALIKFIGLYAAAVSTICSMLYLAIYRYMDINHIMDIRLSPKDIFVMIGMYILFMSLYLINYPMLNIVGLLLSILFCVTWNKKMINSLILILKKRYLRS